MKNRILVLSLIIFIFSQTGYANETQWSDLVHLKGDLRYRHEMIDTETAKTYFNGAFAGQAVGVDMNIDSPVNINISSPEATRFNGVIDEVAIFNVALDVDDINEIMTEGLGEATGITAVEPSGKLAATWASIKAR